MKNTELRNCLQRSGATYLERLTHFDGDVGRWAVKDANHAEVETGLHPKELMHRLSALKSLGLRLSPVLHAAWTEELAKFDRDHEQILEEGGGYSYNAALSQRFLLCENPGDNKMIMTWKVG